MNLLKSLIGKKSEFKIRYSKTADQYQVYRDSQLLYVGTKELCERFIANSPALSS